MLDIFKNILLKDIKIKQNQRILVGVSGGIDSTVLLDLLQRSGFECGIAHCNFMLRAGESNEDENFVRNLAIQYKIPLYSKRFDTTGYAHKKKKSIQVAARELRYAFYEDIIRKHQFDFTAIGHNKDDVVETFLINLTRGTGLIGLTGIKQKNGNIIRPLLSFSRKEILDYSIKTGITYREDSSNSETKYTRNKIRHKIIPLFEEINPEFKGTITANIKRLSDAETIYNSEISKQKNELVSQEKDKVFISIPKLKNLQPLSTYFHELLKEYHFTNQQITDLIHALNDNPGKQFFSSSHWLIKDRDNLIITPLKKQGKELYYIDEGTKEIIEPLHMQFTYIVKNADYKIPRQSEIACIDKDKLTFPLVLRKWKKGDNFAPLGMTGWKKVSDYLVDQKFSLYDKQQAWLLCDGGNIVWIVGHRLDNRYKVTDQTKNILQINFL
jgi:tRNA(Ile)-lysidine synthase